MNNSLGSLAHSLIPGLIFASIATGVWFYYDTELEENQGLLAKSLAQQQMLNDKLLNQQATIDILNDTIKLIEAEKLVLQKNLQQEVSRASSATAELKTELEQQQAELKTELEQQQAELKTELAQQQAELKTELEQQQAELKTEQEQRQAEQESLHGEISAASEEKTKLLSRLEQERISKAQVVNLKSRLEKELDETRVEITLLKNQMTVIKLTNEVLFNSGSADIKPAGKQVLSLIADSLNAYPDRAISVEGHTDDVPVISKTRYESNWELSAARALAAVKFFQQNNQVDPKRLKVVGFGQHQPVASNETAEGRKLNRRIEIKMLPPEAFK